MAFPKVIFGTCEVCGGKGGDDPDASGADAAATDTTGSGLELEYYNGKYVCNVCKHRLENDKVSIKKARKCAREERFRQRVGFVNSVAAE